MGDGSRAGFAASAAPETHRPGPAMRSAASADDVAVAVINYNGRKWLPACLASLRAQVCRPAAVLLVDNASTDDSLALVRAGFPEVRILPMGRNTGYAGGANAAIRHTVAPFLLLLNPDVELAPGFLAALLRVARARPGAGSFAGKLLRPEAGGRPIIDSAGHVLFRNRWALNRGEGEPDTGQYDEPGEVFGVCGAAALYRRAMLEDIAVAGEAFAESFFLYLEDVDVDWRARLRGWTAYYVPTAVARHVRAYRGAGRPRDSTILRHSLKNRYLMMIRNDAAGDLARDAWAILPMEVLRTLDFLLTTPRALRGFIDVLRLLPATLEQRRLIQAGVRVPRAALRPWLRQYPYRARLVRRARLALVRRSGGD